MRISSTDATASPAGFRRWQEADRSERVPPTDARIVTSDGRSVPVHSAVLASASPVLERLLDRSRRGSGDERVVHVLGVSYDAVLTFVELLYSSRTTAMSAREVEEAMQSHGMALLALAHAYRVRWLKGRCEASLARRLSAANAMDALKLARMCDAPRLHLRCMRLAAKEFAAVQQSEGWRFVQKHDPALELEVLQFLDENEQRKKRWRRDRTHQEMYRQLSEAMDCLRHIFAEGCTGVGPRGDDDDCAETPRRRSRDNCTSSETCGRLQVLIHHFATCSKKLEAKGCTHCRRMCQLLRLHASLCDQSDSSSSSSCKVPFCTRLKSKVQRDDEEIMKGEEVTWRLLVKKVVAARVMSSLGSRRRPEEVEVVHKSWLRHRGTRQH